MCQGETGGHAPHRRCCESGGLPGRGSRGWGSVVEPALLAVLGSERAHGYDLRKAVDDMTAGVVCSDPGGTYRTLRRLEEQGFVVSAWADGGSGPRRREYELTAEGLGLLTHWREHLLEREQVLRVVIGAIDEVLAGRGGQTQGGAK